MRKDLIADLQTGFDMNDPVRELYRLEELCSEAADELLKVKEAINTEANYKNAYLALLEMTQRNMRYDINSLTEGKEYDGCLLSGDHFHLNVFAGFVKKYGYYTIEMIIRDIAEGEHHEISDQ